MAVVKTKYAYLLWYCCIVRVDMTVPLRVSVRLFVTLGPIQGHPYKGFSVIGTMKPTHHKPAILKKFCMPFVFKGERSALKEQNFSTLNHRDSLRVFSTHDLAINADLTNWSLFCRSPKLGTCLCNPFDRTDPKSRIRAHTATFDDA